MPLSKTVFVLSRATSCPECDDEEPVAVFTTRVLLQDFMDRLAAEEKKGKELFSHYVAEVPVDCRLEIFEQTTVDVKKFSFSKKIDS